MKSLQGSVEDGSWYLPEGSPAGVRGDSEALVRERFVPTRTTAGPWSAKAQHGGPPAALLGRALEGVLPGGGTVARFAMDLLGPVGLGPLVVSAEVVRPGRTVSLLRAELRDEEADRVCATATAWALPSRQDGPASDEPPVHGPGDGVVRETPPGWLPGYLDSIEWRWVEGVLGEPGPGVVWMRPRVTLVPGERLSPLQRVLSCVDSASGVSAGLDIREWAFMNTELTVQLLRPARGEWVCLDAATTLGTGAVGIATSRVLDLDGLVGRSAQTLLVTRR